MSETPALTLETIVCASANQVSTRVGDDAVVLDLDGSVYYELDPVGARVLELVEGPVPLAAVVDAIVGEFDVTRETAGADLLELVAELAERRLVEVRPPSAKGHSDGDAA